MADTKITALAAIATVDPAADVLPIVDISDTSMAASGTTKKVTSNQILGAGGTATLASATITGDLTVDTSTLKVDSTNNRVGIGTASPGAPLDIFANNLADAILIRGNDNANVRIRMVNSGAGGEEFALSAGIPSASNSSFVIRSVTAASNRYIINQTGEHAWATNAGTAMTLNSSGNVGIGVTPSAWDTSVFKAIQIGTGVGQASVVSRTDNVNNTAYGLNYYYGTGAYRYIAAGRATNYEQASGKHLWNIDSGTQVIGAATSFTQAMTLDASGNLLVGTTSLVGTERLIVTKTTVGSVLARFVNTNTTVDTYGIAVSYSASTPNDASHYFLGCFDSTTSRAFIYANGGLANYSANNVNLSDARTKTDIKPLTSYWNKIKALELVTFKYKDQTHDDDNIGLISQQVESVAPEFVSNEGFGETPADGVPLKSIYTTDLYHAAIKALQEAMTRIEVLESKLA